MITGLEHIAIYTRDMDATKEFYVGRLGFHVTWEGMVDTGNGFTHAVTARLGSCVLELVQPPDLSRVNETWGPVQHFALHTDDLDSTIRELEAIGVPIREAPGQITYEGGVYHAFIYGPSHERIELVEQRRMQEQASSGEAVSEDLSEIS